MLVPRASWGVLQLLFVPMIFVEKLDRIHLAFKIISLFFSLVKHFAGMKRVLSVNWFTCGGYQSMALPCH